MCGCVHYDAYQYYTINIAKRYLEQYDNGILIVDKLDDRFDIDYPIIYNKKS